MKKAFFVVCLFTLFYGISLVHAQKAYDIISYKSTIFGNQVTLQIADGYLLASKVVIRSKSGDQVFAPLTDEPDGEGDLRFDVVKGTGIYKDNKGSWLTLKKLAGQEYSSRVKAVYWDGKMLKNIIFKLQR